MTFSFSIATCRISEPVVKKVTTGFINFVQLDTLKITLTYCNLTTYIRTAKALYDFLFVS
jgi:hypothetical protein